MAFFGLESSWADDGLEQEPEGCVGQGEQEGGDFGEQEDGVGVCAGEELWDDTWADDFVPTAAPLLEEGIFGEAGGAKEALELLQLLAAPPPAAPSARAPAGRPSGRTGTHSTLVDLGVVGGWTVLGPGGGGLRAAFPPSGSFFL